jgi:rRNA-processing protein EBP2
LSEKKEIAESEERKHQRQMRKFGKQIQVQKKQERSKQKRDDMDKIKKWREGLCPRLPFERI